MLHAGEVEKQDESLKPLQGLSLPGVIEKRNESEESLEAGQLGEGVFLLRRG